MDAYDDIYIYVYIYRYRYIHYICPWQQCAKYIGNCGLRGFKRYLSSYKSCYRFNDQLMNMDTTVIIIVLFGVYIYIYMYNNTIIHICR